MSVIEITRQDLSILQLRAAAARTADAKQVRRILAIAMVLDGHARLLAAGPAAWTGRRCATGCIATTRMGWRGSRTGPGLGVSCVWPKPSGAKWRSGEVGRRRP